MNTLKPLRYPLFDILRLVLALEVVSGHLFAPERVPAVAGFLAISGFLIPQSYRDSRSYGHFAWKRAVRILPALLAVLLAIALVGGLANSLLTLKYYLTFGFSAPSWDDALWSLPFEEALYACLAI